MRNCSFIIIGLLMSAFCSAQIEPYDSLFIALYGEEQLKDSTETQRFDYHFYEGIRELQNRYPREAIAQLNRCLEIRPTAEVYYELSRAYLQLNDTKRSFDYLRQAATLRPEVNSYQEVLANYYLAMSNYASALAIYESLHKRNPGSLSYLYQLIGVGGAMNDPKKVLSYLDDLEQLTGLNDEIAFERMNIYTTQNKPKKVEAELKRLIAKFPSQNYYKVLLGDFYISQNKFDKGLTIYNDILKERPNDGFALLALSNYYRLQNNTALSDSLILLAMNDRELPFEEKINELRPLIVGLIQTQQDAKVDSIFDSLLFNYGEESSLRKFHVEYLRSKGDTIGMIDEFRVLIAGDPKDEQNWYQLMELLWNDATKADMLDLAIAAEAQFKNLQWGFYHVIGLMMNEKEAVAANYIDTLMEKFPNGDKQIRAQLYNFQGDYYAGIDSLAKAIAIYDASLALVADNAMVLNNYAYFLARANNDLRKAERMASKAIELDPTNANCLDTYAWVFFMRGDYRSAKFYLERAMGYEESAVMYDHYGDVLFKLGDVTGALKNWQKALEMGCESEVLEEKIATQSYIPEVIREIK